MAKDTVTKDDEVTGTFVSDERELSNKTTFSIEVIKGKKQLSALIGAEVGETVVLKTKDLFKDDHDNQKYLGVSHEDAHGLDIEVSLKIEEVNTREMAELDQDLFNKLFGEGVITSEEQLKERVKADAEKQFEQQSDQKLLNDVVESLIENTKFDLPSDFLRRWIQISGEKEMTKEEAKEEFDRSEKGLRYQLIEGKLRAENNLQVTFEELKDHSKNMIKAQMAQFGQMNPTEEEVEAIVARIMGNEEEVKRLSEQLNTNKMLMFFKENAKLKTKEITYEKFMKEAYA
jgi:trigger factor